MKRPRKQRGSARKTEKRDIPKCVKLYSQKLPEETLAVLEELYSRYNACRNDFFRRFYGPGNMAFIQNPKKLRDALKKECLGEIYGLSVRFWTSALFSACAVLKSAWSNQAGRVKEQAKENPNLSAEEKAYIRYLVSVPAMWQAVLLWKEVPYSRAGKKLLDAVNPGRLKAVHNYIRRVSRRKMFRVPCSEECRCIGIDQECYNIHAGEFLFRLSTHRKGKRIGIFLKSPWCYRTFGDLQVIFDRGRKWVEIHKVIMLDKGQHGDKGIIGVDKGYHDLLSCSDGNEYGKGIGNLFNKQADRLCERGKGRNQYIQEHKRLKEQYGKLSEQLEKEQDPVKRKYILANRRRVYGKMRNLEENNLGSKLFSRQQKRNRAFLEQQVNLAVKELSAYSGVAVEDLRWSGNNRKGREFNRKISMWLKGFLQERIDCVCSLYGIPVTEVNPVYTSQYCHACGSPVTREGKYKETAVCPVCGRMNANVNASENILSRLDDKEITRFTPTKEVKRILDRRHAEALKAMPACC